MKLADLKVGTDYATRADGQWSAPKRVRVLEIGEYKTRRVTGRVYRDFRGGSYGPPTEEVETKGVRLQYLYDDGSPQRLPVSDPEWTQANQIASTWEDHLKARAATKAREEQIRTERVERELRLQEGLNTLCNVLRDRGLGFHGTVADVFAVGRRIQLALTVEQAEALTEVLRGEG